MAIYDITDKQKYLLTTIINHINAGKMEEPIIPSCTFGGCEIIGIEEHFGHNLIGDLDVLCDAGLLAFRYNSQANKIYTIKQAGYVAVENDFVMPDTPVNTQVNIGAIVHEMKGGNFQAIGSASESEVKQIVNDPQLLSDEITTLTNQLLEVIKTDLPADKLVAYIKNIDELKTNITSEKPSQSILQRLFNSLAFMSNIEGTISLTARVWPYLYPILLIASERIIATG